MFFVLSLRHLFAVLSLLSLFTGLSLAQEITPEALSEGVSAQFVAEDAIVFVGEPTTLILNVVVSEGYALRGWPEFPQEWSAFYVSELGDITVSEDERSYTQAMTVTIWRIGEYRTPTTFISAENLSTGRLERFRVEPAVIFVPSSLNMDDLNLRPFREPADLFYISPVVVLLAGFGAFGGLYYTLKRWRQLNYTRSVSRRVAPPVSPFNQAVETLQAIDYANRSPLDVYQQVGKIIRAFLASHFQLNLDDLTSQEIVRQLDEHRQLTHPQAEALQRLLQQIDLVKFANAQPDAEDTQRIILISLKWLQSLSVGAERDE